MPNVSKYQSNPEEKNEYMLAYGDGFKRGWDLLFIWSYSGTETNIPIELQSAYYDGKEDGYRAGLRLRSNYEPKLGYLIAKADRVTVADFGISKTITGEEVKKIVKATPKALPIGRTGGLFQTELKFYRGTNFITEVYWQGDCFVYQQQEYYDDSGVLVHFYDSAISTMMLERQRNSK